MIVKDLNGQILVSTRSFDRIELLDGGDTVAVHLTCSDYIPLTVMMTRIAMQNLVSAFADDPIHRRDPTKGFDT